MSNSWNKHILNEIKHINWKQIKELFRVWDKNQVTESDCKAFLNLLEPIIAPVIDEEEIDEDEIDHIGELLDSDEEADFLELYKVAESTPYWKDLKKAIHIYVNEGGIEWYIDTIEKNKNRIHSKRSKQMNKWMKDAYGMIKSGKELNESWLRDLAMDAGKYYEIGQGRWTAYMVTVINFDKETYLLFWEKGLTECQENIFEEQPVKVDTKFETKVVKFAINHYVDSTGKELFKEEMEIPEE